MDRIGRELSTLLCIYERGNAETKSLVLPMIHERLARLNERLPSMKAEKQ
jgi:hypothetical protein